MRMKCDIKAMARLIGLRPADWEGQCHGVATKLIEHKAFIGRVERGHFRGKISACSRWAAYKPLGFAQHSWIITDDGRIVDPTRWCFEYKTPYVYICAVGNKDYDPGGTVWRAQCAKPPPSTEGDSEICDIYEILENMCEPEAAELVETLLLQSGPTAVDQLVWLANLPYDTFGEHTKAIYSAIDWLKCRAFIPIDNWARAGREWKKAGVA